MTARTKRDPAIPRKHLPKTARISPEEFEARAGVVSIVLRPDITLHIAGIPHNMTEAEARKITAIVLAYGGADV